MTCFRAGESADEAKEGQGDECNGDVTPTTNRTLQALFLLWAYRPNLQTKDWWPAAFDCRPPKCSNFSTR
jgi:hypothetical protein